MGITDRMKMKLMKKSFKKLKEHMPSLKEFAVENNQAYNALLKVMIEINEKRRAKRKYVVSSI